MRGLGGSSSPWKLPAFPESPPLGPKPRLYLRNFLRALLSVNSPASPAPGAPPAAPGPTLNLRPLLIDAPSAQRPAPPSCDPASRPASQPVHQPRFHSKIRPQAGSSPPRLHPGLSSSHADVHPGSASGRSISQPRPAPTDSHAPSPRASLTSSARASSPG